MQRYFGSIIGKQVLLTEEDQYHVTKVMRMRPCDQIEVVSDGIAFLCNIKNIKPLEIEMIRPIHEKRELDTDVILIAALLKGDKFDFMLQKATELGVSEIVLVSTERTIVRTDDYNSAKKLERYRRILKEAAEQSHRTRIPDLYRFITLGDLNQIKADVKMIAYEDVAGNTKSFWNELKKSQPGQKIAVLIGPEGGFSKREVEIAENFGFAKVSLGNRILRGETASLYALSVIASYIERK